MPPRGLKPQHSKRFGRGPGRAALPRPRQAAVARILSEDRCAVWLRLRRFREGIELRSAEDLRDQVVVVGLGDFAAVELARLWVKVFGEIVHENLAVNLGSVH